MKALRIAALTAALALGGVSTAQARDPGDGLPPTGPACYGANYSYHVWNLVHPMTVFGVTSCAINRTITLRASTLTYIQFATALTAYISPQAAGTAGVLGILYNMNTDMLRYCAVRGTGVELAMSNMTGMVIQCRAQ